MALVTCGDAQKSKTKNSSKSFRISIATYKVKEIKSGGGWGMKFRKNTQRLFELMDQLHQRKEDMDYQGIHVKSNRLDHVEKNAIEIEKIAIELQRLVNEMRVKKLSAGVDE